MKTGQGSVSMAAGLAASSTLAGTTLSVGSRAPMRGYSGMMRSLSFVGDRRRCGARLARAPRAIPVRRMPQMGDYGVTVPRPIADYHRIKSRCIQLRTGKVAPRDAEIGWRSRSLRAGPEMNSALSLSRSKF